MLTKRKRLFIFAVAMGAAGAVIAAGNVATASNNTHDVAVTVSGTIAPGDVLGPSAQGIAAGEFAELVKAIRAGFAYVNVHSTLYPVGELRAQFDHH
ncbi:MAG TPA: CHRD domain-containing protein [Streptosporangiaceae bacterium]|nr:CHRD domain-containing protein [Streptosporangiaceae bacterium]